MFKLTDEEFSSVIDAMISSLGVKENGSFVELRDLLNKKDTQGCVQEIAARLGLPVRISLAYVSDAFKPGDESGFRSSALSRTDWRGHGTEGITAQVAIPPSLPRFGSLRLAGYEIKVRLSEKSSRNAETFVAVMAHEISHVLLEALLHPNKDSELHTDLVPILLGFRDIVRVGRKTIRTSTNGNRTNTQTTTYGYLNDQQFEMACQRVEGVVRRHRLTKHRVLDTTRECKNTLDHISRTLTSFREYLLFLDTRQAVKMRERDAPQIVGFHAPDYTREWEAKIVESRGYLDASAEFAQSVSHYTSVTTAQLEQRAFRLTSLGAELEHLRNRIDSDVKVLRRNVGLGLRLRRLISSRAS